MWLVSFIASMPILKSLANGNVLGEAVKGECEGLVLAKDSYKPISSSIDETAILQWLTIDTHKDNPGINKERKGKERKGKERKRGEV